ncbi:hypothetical protein [Streptomyces sp. NPDC059389]|uniref:hypothetical protein n=1 Tax=Streptomyces sp. NPDC059389 TaxID=3346818 RepID=UPI0036CF9D24
MLGGVVLAAPAAHAAPAPAPADLNCTTWKVYGNPHEGAATTCTGGAFTGWIDCRRYDNGYVYRHFGNRALSGGTTRPGPSAVICGAAESGR